MIFEAGWPAFYCGLMWTYAFGERRSGLRGADALRRDSLDAPINRALVDVVQYGFDEDAFDHVDVETGILLVMGTIVITLRHLFEERIATEPSEIARRMAAGLLRSLGVTAGRAGRLAREATLAVLG